MKLKRGVNRDNVHALLWGKLLLADKQHIVTTGEELVVTSLRRPVSSGSRHSPAAHVPVTSADIRRWRLDALDGAEDFCSWLQTVLDLAVLLEPDWMTKEQIEERGGRNKIDPHIHCELRIQPGEVGFEWTD